MSLIRLVEFPVIPHETGSLSVYEQSDKIGFDIKRIYCLTRLALGAARGSHAHRALRQVAVCLSGSCRFILDDGKTREDVVLDNPGIGLHIGTYIWREMKDFSSDCVLMVIASELYSEPDYIRDYDEFLQVVKA